MRLRIRGPSGTSTVTLPDTATVLDLRAEIVAKTAVEEFDLKKGYPPQPLLLDAYDPEVVLADAGLRLNGEQLTVSPKQAAVPPPAAADSTASRPSPEKRPAADPAENAAADSPELPLPTHGGTLVMRVMPDDNSCLFRAVSSAVLGADIDMMHELRTLVAEAIRADKDTYTSAVLDKDPEHYCRWIQTDAAWGGAIELGILAQHFQIEIASISVKDGRVDRFNEGAPRRCILVYSLIHYDVLAISHNDSLGLGFRKPPEQDEKLFDADDDEVLARALELCAILRDRNYYTDVTEFRIRCNDCGWVGNGEKAMARHAETTGHWNFDESRA